MAKEMNEMLEGAIAQAFEDLEAMTPEHPAYNAQIGNVVKLYEQHIQEAKLDAEASRAALDRGLESEKMEHDLAMKREESKQNWVRVGADIAKGITLVVANGLWIKGIMHFEETGTIATKAFQLIFKPKF